MEVLVVAPDNNLLFAKTEAQNVINTLKANALIGRVTFSELFNHLSENKYDYIHVIAHGSADGICLSDKCVQPVAFAQIVSLAEPTLVYLNSCSSISVASAVRDLLPQTTIITTITDINDEESYVSGTIFARAMAETQWDIDKSYEKSKRRGNANYVMLRGNRHVMEHTSSVSGKDIINAIIELSARMERYDSKTIAISSAFLTFAQEIKDIKSILSESQKKEVIYHPEAWIAGYVMFAASVFVASNSYDFFVELSPVVKTNIAIMMQIIASLFFIYGLGWIHLWRKK